MGRRIWSLSTYAGQTICVGPWRVESFKQFLPRGRWHREQHDGTVIISEREQSLVQIWTDHGMRTIAVASVWAKDPGKSVKPW